MDVIAHRGASRAARENTVEAFRLAAELGADWVELDARRIAGGTVIVHHDARLDNGVALSTLGPSDLPGHIPTLSAALDACRGMGVNIEIKNDPHEPDFDRTGETVATVTAIAAERTDATLLVSSFDGWTLDEVRALAPDLPLATLVVAVDDIDELIADTAARGHAALHPHVSMVDEALVERVHEAGMAVNVWTVDEPDTIARLAAIGVDGVCTNVPDVARAVLAARQDGSGSPGRPGR